MSKYSPGPAPKSQTLTIAAAGQGIKLTATGVDGDGKPINTSYTANFDGKDSPVTGNPDYDMVAVKRIDAMTTESTRKKAGKVVSTSNRVLSMGSTMMTVTTTGTDAKGQKINNVAMHDRQ